jgi:glycosyltransferase involved in cell wall biosynthesis
MEDTKLKVIQIIDRLHIGGAERVLVMISNILQQHGHTVKVITTVSDGPLVHQLHKDIQYLNLRRQWKWNIVTMRKLVNEIKDYDVIHVHSSHNLRYVYLAMKLFRITKPIFFHEHYGDIHIDPSIRWHQKLVYPKVIFIGVSSKHTQWAIQKLKMPEEQVFLLPNTVEKLIVDQSVKRKETRNQLLLVSNFRSSKNIEFAIELFSELKKIESIYRLTIIGQIADKEYYEKIQNLISKNGLKSEIEFVHNCSNIQPFLHQFDFALHTAVSESGPLVLIEYMAQGLPFLTYNAGEVVEEIKSKIPLAVLNSFDKNEWLNRIQTLLSLPLDDLSHKFSNLYDHYFSTEGYYKKLIEIYQTVLSRNKKKNVLSQN